MNELMIHVERIVRPVRATDRWKLAMRRELLTHLESAMTEERARCADDAVALDRAEQRLGDPAELTLQLQRSVPRLQRLLRTRLPITSELERLERRGSEIYRMDRITTGHSAILVAGAVLICAAAYVMPVLPMIGRAQMFDWSPEVLVILGGISAQVMLVLACIFAGAVGRAAVDMRRAALAAGAMLGIHLGWSYLAIRAVLVRAPNFGELAGGMLATLLAMLVCAVLGRWVAVLRRPYDPWLTLDVAS